MTTPFRDLGLNSAASSIIFRAMSVTSELRRRVRAERSPSRYEPCQPSPAKDPPAISRALVMRIGLQKSFVERHRMTQLVKLNARLGAAQKTQQHTAPHFCSWKEPMMLLRHPHSLPNSKAVALLPCMDCPHAHGNSGVVALILEMASPTNPAWPSPIVSGLSDTTAAP